MLNSGTYQPEIECETRDQHQSSEWYIVRQHRISASKAKRCLLRDSTSPTKAIAAVLQYGGNFQSKAMREGIEWEGKIIERYEYLSGNKVERSGFIVSLQHPFLGASPDGVIHNGAGVIEVKKVTSKEGESFEETLCRLQIYKKHGTLQVNQKHKYYMQMQQQMYCKGVHYCHFIISDGVWVHTDVVKFNKPFWDDVLPRLENFYFSHVLPEIVYPRILHGCVRWGKDISFPVSP